MREGRAPIRERTRGLDCARARPQSRALQSRDRALDSLMTDLSRQGPPNQDGPARERRFRRFGRKAREVSERRVLPAAACARGSTGGGRKRCEPAPFAALQSDRPLQAAEQQRASCLWTSREPPQTMQVRLTGARSPEPPTSRGADGPGVHPCPAAPREMPNAGSLRRTPNDKKCAGRSFVNFIPDGADHPLPRNRTSSSNKVERGLPREQPAAARSLGPAL